MYLQKPGNQTGEWHPVKGGAQADSREKSTHYFLINNNSVSRYKIYLFLIYFLPIIITIMYLQVSNELPIFFNTQRVWLGKRKCQVGGGLLRQDLHV